MNKKIQGKLFGLQDSGYRDFQSKLMPTVDKNTVIGVRMPYLRKLALQIGIDNEFLSSLPHAYYEENNLHALMIMQIEDYQQAIDAVNDFIPYIDNWATCDLLSPKVFEKALEKGTKMWYDVRVLKILCRNDGIGRRAGLKIQW